MRSNANNLNLPHASASKKLTAAAGARQALHAPALPKRPTATSRDATPRVNKSPLPSARTASPKRRTVPPLATVPRLIDQCMPSCLSSRGATSAAPKTEPEKTELVPRVGVHSSPSAKVTKRPNGTYAHLLRLPSTIPYAIRLHAASPQGTVHVLPCLSPAVAQFIREDAERTAQRLGGWAPRAVGCCTNDVLVSQLSAASQQHVLDAFRRVIMPFAMRAFPEAKLSLAHTEMTCTASVSGLWIMWVTAEHEHSESNRPRSGVDGSLSDRHRGRTALTGRTGTPRGARPRARRRYPYPARAALVYGQFFTLIILTEGTAEHGTSNPI